MTKPIIFLAFANDRQPGGAYLRNLPEEARSLQAALRPAEDAALCQVVLQQNVTLAQVLSTFQDPRYRHQISIFHYGGHANAYQLLLESNAGELAPAAAPGFATFLAQQRGLHLVFLNGCSTEPQVQALLAAGVSLVIATAQAIDDQVATTFATHFYQGLASGATVQSAFDEAVGASRTQSGDDLRVYYIGGAHPNQPPADRWPWTLYQRPGSTSAAQWNLPQAADNPLFGLPPLPALDLPPHPFRYLQYFRRADAPIFFGRSHQIRALYTRITDPRGAPIILLYGQSGVGKSSLLAAGLLPRLEADHQVRYLPRNQATGLLGALATGLDLADMTAPSAATPHLAAAWRAQEQAKPLTIILDQVEELYTRPQPDPQAELGAFLTALVALFNDPSQRPQGKLLLSFRKEYLPELKQRLTARALPLAELFLERLDQQGIHEAITGIPQASHLQQHYRLTVATDLAATIAQDLRADQGAALAPMLQILLSKLWDRARARNYAQPHFDLALYAELCAQGLLLSDFLDQQLSALRQAQPAAVDTGLALDLLAFHTTRLGTAEQRTRSELHATYPAQTATIQSLVQHGRDLYLLADPAENHPDQEPATRLAHDTLAPLIRARFDESDLPGQRARRILESRAIDWEGDKPATPLDSQDLSLVEAGLMGMRTGSLAEQRLLTASRQAQAKRQRLTRILWAGGTLLFIITLLFGVYAWIQRNFANDRQHAALASEATAQAESTRANEARATSDINAAIAITRSLEAQAAQATAEANRTEALNQARLAKAGELAAAAGREVAQPIFDPSLALLLAMRAVTMTQPSDGPIFVNATTALDEVIRRVPPWRMTLFGHKGDLVSAVFSPDGRRILTASYDNTPRVWDARNGQLLYTLQGHTTSIMSAVFSPNGRHIVTASYDNTARIWDTSNGQLLHTLQGHTGYVMSAVFNPHGDQIATASVDGSVRIWDTESGQLRHILQGHTGPVYSAIFSSNGYYMISASADTTACIWDVQTFQILHCLHGHTHSVVSAAFNPDGSRVVTASFDNTPRVWDTKTGKLLYALQGHTNGAVTANFSPNGKLIVTGSADKTARVWDTSTGQLIYTLRGHTAAIVSAIFSPDGHRIITTSEDTTVRIWDVETGQLLYVLQGHTGSVVSASFSPDGQQIVTAGDQTVRIWDTEIGQTLHTLQGHTDTVMSAIFSSDDRYIATTSYDKTTRIWNATTGQELHQLLGHTNLVVSVAFSPNGQHIVTASNDGTARIWDTQTGKELHQLQGHTNRVNLALFSPDGQRIITTSDDGTACIWNTQTGKELHQLQGHTNGITSADFSSDDKFIVTAANDNTARIWDIQTGQLLHTLQGHKDSVTSASFSPNNQRVVTASADNTARIWSVNDGTMLYLLQGHTDSIFSAAYSPDGYYIVTASFDKTVRVWNANTGQLLHTLQEHIDRITPAVFSPDGQRLVTTNSETKIAHIWDIKTGKWLYQLQGHTAPIFSAIFNKAGTRIVTASEDRTARIWFSSVSEYLTVARRLIQRNPPDFTPEERARYGLDQ